MDVSKIVEEIGRVLDEKDEVREKALKITREVVRLSGDTIKALHRKDFKLAEERLEKAETLVGQLRELLEYHKDIYASGYVQTAHQEFVEALLFYHYLKGVEFPLPREIGIPEADYALGLGDLIGELRRHVLLAMLEGNLEEAEKTYIDMEHIYEELMRLDYPKGLVNLRQKQDSARKLVERTLEDLTRAKLTKELEDKIKEVLQDES
ncbi:haloacid dehalogenase [Palaeococcus sp. (in: euryarchaeotes)]